MHIDVPRILQQGRESYERRSWVEAFHALTLVDESTALRVEDLERLATAAYLVGRDDDYLRLLERTHRQYLNAGESAPAARCAFWLGLRLIFRGEVGPASGWFGRGRRLIEQEELDCVEQGYLMLPLVEQRIMVGNLTAAYETAAEAAGVGRRFGEADLVACALHLQGRALILQQEVERGLALLDESMVAVTSGELSPIMTGLIYCSVIDACRQVYAFSRAGEWTVALAHWCADQPELVAFTDRCLVHRSEIMQLKGAWDDAIAEAERAGERLAERDDRKTAAAAHYQQGELHRLRGDYAAAEAAYRSANQWGWEPQPGLALLRLAQGRLEAARTAIRRVAAATTDPLQRLKLLPAYVEIMLAAGDADEAQGACRELEAIADSYGTDALRATVAHARGTVELSDGKAQEALASLQRARGAWQDLQAPYPCARVRVDIAQACRALGDEEGATMELDAARTAFERLGAAPDIDRLASLVEDKASDRSHGLTARELQVLRLLASGRTNKAIASELSLSGRTIDRHVSSILSKLDVPSRAAATAYAYENSLVCSDRGNG